MEHIEPKSLEITLTRIARRPTYTIGRLYIDSERMSDTIEDRDRGLDDSMPEARIRELKVYGMTAIPTGRYRVSLTRAEKFKNRVWAKAYKGLIPVLENVKGFTGIRIHPANTAEELLGCIAPGENTTVGRVNSSTAAYYRIMNRLVPAWNAGIPIYINIS